MATQDDDLSTSVLVDPEARVTYYAAVRRGRPTVGGRH